MGMVHYIQVWYGLRDFKITFHLGKTMSVC